MNSMKILALLYIAISVLILLTGCNLSNSINNNGKSQNGLEVSGMSTALGAVGDSLDKTRFSKVFPQAND